MFTCNTPESSGTFLSNSPITFLNGLCGQVDYTFGSCTKPNSSGIVVEYVLNDGITNPSGSAVLRPYLINGAQLILASSGLSYNQPSGDLVISNSEETVIDGTCVLYNLWSDTILVNIKNNMSFDYDIILASSGGLVLSFHFNNFKINGNPIDYFACCSKQYCPNTGQNPLTPCSCISDFMINPSLSCIHNDFSITLTDVREL